MTNTIVSKMTSSEDQEVDGSFLQITSYSSPVKGKPRPVKNCNSPPKGGRVHYDSHFEGSERSRVRFGSCSSMSPRGSPNGKSRSSPSKSPRQSPSQAELYAGFSDSPAPAALPKPPSHWMNTVRLMTSGRSCFGGAVGFASNNMKLLLKAQA